MKFRKCECHAYSANECACGAWKTHERVDIEDIKQNGIDPKSKLFWALVDGNYLVQSGAGDFFISNNKPILAESHTGCVYYKKTGCSEAFVLKWRVENEPPKKVAMKIKYTGDWKDSLHYRGDYE